MDWVRVGLVHSILVITVENYAGRACPNEFSNAMFLSLFDHVLRTLDIDLDVNEPRLPRERRGGLNDTSNF